MKPNPRRRLPKSKSAEKSAVRQVLESSDEVLPVLSSFQPPFTHLAGYLIPLPRTPEECLAVGLTWLGDPEPLQSQHRSTQTEDGTKRA